MEHVGPGSYNKSGDTAPVEKKKFGGALSAAFGTVDSRKLDTTNPGHKIVPGPGQYQAVKPGKEFISMTPFDKRR